MAPMNYTSLATEEAGEKLTNLTHSMRPSSRRPIPRRLLLAVVGLFALLCASWRWDYIKRTWRGEPGRSCTHSARPKYTAPKQNIWRDLDEHEFEDILKFLYTVPNDLNLTRVVNATSWDNHIAIIETLVPNKTDALKYLDTDSVKPTRYARVIINHGAAEQATLDEYMVGPLPASQDTKIEPLTWTYNSGRHSVQNPLSNYEDIVAWFSDLGKEVSDIVDDLLGGVVNHNPDTNLPPVMAVSRPAAFENNTVSQWARIHSYGKRFDAWSLLAQGLFCRFEIKGRDSSLWKIREWYYDGIIYNSTESFRAAWKSGKLHKTAVNIDGAWTASEPNEKGIPGREHVAPIMVQPGGPRYNLDEEQRHVDWMGWSFYLNSLQAIGLGLWDVKFGGERILYEVGLQEAMAHYAGADPLSVGMYWLDTLFGMGFNSYELVPGFDCPSYATFMPMTFHQGEKTVTRNNSLCVFEWTASDLLQRHTSPTRVTASRNNHLIVRQVATVGNYDYTISYIFYLDGSMEVKVQASGYIFGAYHTLEVMRKDFSKRAHDTAQYDYGYRIHDLVVSSMHDHGINFKADFDIAGTENEFYRVDISPYHHNYEWEKDIHRSTMRLNHSPIEKETHLDWPSNSAAMYAVLNNESTNIWGEKRGYRIAPGLGMGTPPHLVVKDSTSMARSASWAYHDLWVLKHHDHERRSASEYNAMEPQDPLIDFAKMVNKESISKEDLVVYFNLGAHHIPHSGDVPNTLMHTSASSVMFVPLNFHDRDASRASAQGVKLTMKGKDQVGSKVDYYGGVYEKAARIALEELEPDLSYYRAPENAFGTMDMSWNATLAAL